MIRPTPTSTLFPYTTLFRSAARQDGRAPEERQGLLQDGLAHDLRGRVLRAHLLRRRHDPRSEEHTSELQSQSNLVCRLLLEKKKNSCRYVVGWHFCRF